VTYVFIRCTFKNLNISNACVFSNLSMMLYHVYFRTLGGRHLRYGGAILHNLLAK
jgi:hypothetical protein